MTQYKTDTTINVGNWHFPKASCGFGLIDCQPNFARQGLPRCWSGCRYLKLNVKRRVKCADATDVMQLEDRRRQLRLVLIGIHAINDRESVS